MTPPRYHVDLHDAFTCVKKSNEPMVRQNSQVSHRQLYRIIRKGESAKSVSICEICVYRFCESSLRMRLRDWGVMPRYEAIWFCGTSSRSAGYVLVNVR